MTLATAASRLLSFTLLSFAALHAQASCKAPSLGAFAGVERSQWREWDSTGRRLVKETGNLARTGLAISAQCQSVDWQIQWSQSQGDRNYDGLTNRYAPLKTSSDIRSQLFAAQLWLPLNAAWAIGTELNWREIERRIADQGLVQGYPERFRYGQAGIGLRYKTRLTPSIALNGALTAGLGYGGTNRIALPGFESRELPLGKQRYASLGIEVSSGQAELTTGLSWTLGFHYRVEKNDAGEARPLYRNGIASGSAQQPRFTQDNLGANLMFTYRF